MDNMDKTPTLELDELDLMLARELELDARQSNRTLSRKLAISEATVKRRLQKLLGEGVITIAAFTDQLSLGFKTGVFMGLKISPGKVDEVAECLRPFSRVQRIILTTGCYDIIISTLFHNPREVGDFIDEDLSCIPNLVISEKIMFFENIKTSWKYLNGDTERYQQPTPRDLDELDLRLIKELELCPRGSASELGRKLRVDRKLVARRLQALLADNIVQVVSIVKPSFFGLNMHVFIFLKVQPGKIRSVANSLITERRVHHICLTTGPFELFLSAAFRDLEELSDFLRNHLGSYPGVTSHETLIQVAFPKRSYSLLT